MKYIRTINGFYGFVSERSISLGGYVKGKYYHGVMDRRLHRLGAGLLQDKYIIEQSDTIEELVDEYVLREKANCKLCVDYAELTEDDVKLCLQDHDIFGAIWTDKGLIYVAKMNSKGELELL